VSFYRTHRRAPEEAGTLEAWTGPVQANAIEALLLKFGDADILERAQTIPDDNLSLREDSRRRLAAYVGDTTVDIDFEEHTIVHRCPEWSVSASQKRFCPHVVKLFMSINQQKSTKILSLIQSAVDDWKFESRLAVEFPTRNASSD
jgi:hypothetical protein